MTRHVNINENDVNAILGFNEWKRFGVSLKEGTETHSCPLCESKLPEALSQETLKEHVAAVMQMVEETLAEAADAVDAEDLDETDEVEDTEETEADDSEDSEEVSDETDED